jgi:hypothetical protein
LRDVDNFVLQLLERECEFSEEDLEILERLRCLVDELEENTREFDNRPDLLSVAPQIQRTITALTEKE